MKTKHLQIGRAGRYMLLLLMLPLMAAKAYAYDFSAVCSTGQALYYNITDNGNHLVELTCPGTNYSPWGSYTEPTGNITIPSTVTYNDVAYTVAAIGDDAFYNCSGLTGSLTIPDSVTEIGDEAFRSCSGFTGSLTIPNSVTNIGGAAFEDCGFTGSLTIGNSVTYIGEGAFYYCYGFTGSLTIPNSVTEIGDYAFASCSGFTGSLTIPNSVTGIGEYAFAGCSGFTGSLTIGNSVTEIGDYAFYYCNGLTGSLTIPNSVTEIGEGAFLNCSGFTGSLTIGNSVTEIGAAAFAFCSGFTGSLTIPNSVTEIGESAFAYCTNLQFLQVEAFNPPIIGNNTFEDVNKAIPVTVPCGSLSAYQTAPYWRDFTNIREGTGVEENDAASSANFAYISNGELVISCEGKNTLHIFDMMGRMLSSQTINGDCRISANWMTAGTYILNLNGMAQKIVVK